MKILIIFLFSHNLLLAQDSAFDPTDNGSLTLEEEIAADNYIHEGKALRQYNQACFDENGRPKEICQQGDNAFSGAWGTIESMLPFVTKAYATVVGTTGGGKFKSRLKDNEGNQLYNVNGESEPRVLSETNGEKPEDFDQATEEKQDYCAYLSIAGEAFNTGFVALNNQKTEQNFQTAKPEARQAASFYALADNEDTMKKGAKMQFYTWGATAACYGIYALSPSIVKGPSLWAKLAASTLIAEFYRRKSKAHGERGEELRKLARDLPQAGDCNPFTETSCFCAEPTSGGTDPANFQKYCIAAPLITRAGGPGEPVPCVDQRGKVDNACQCKRNNTCIDRTLRIVGADLGLNPITLRDPLRGISPLSNGLDSANLNSSARRNLAFADKALQQSVPSDLGNLNKKQREDAKTLASFGIPKTAAATLSKFGSPSASGVKIPSSISGAGNLAAGTLADSSKDKNLSNSDQRRFKVASKARGSGGSKSLTGLRRKKRAKRSNVEIAKYGDQATREAEIRRDDGKGIFEIISYRYKVSAWREFSDSLQAEQRAPTTQK